MKSLLLLGVFFYLLHIVVGHGRLVEPPSRATMWRYGFKTPENYNDNQLYCGGLTRQWSRNGGKCGVCGDPWDVKQPRPHEAGGKFARGVIVRNYTEGQTINTGVQLTANHQGYFEFRLCQTDDPLVPATDECLDQNILQLADGSGPRFYPGPGNKIFESVYQLPADLTCRQCVLQWRYVAGNNWGMCENGTGKLGCGKQEQFRACADISITAADGSVRPTPTSTTVVTTVVMTTPPSTKTYVITIVNRTELDRNEEEIQIVEEFMHGGLIAVAILSLLTTGLFFLSLFLYYHEGGKKIKKIILMCRECNKPKKRPPLPPLPMHLDPSMKEDGYYSTPFCDKTKSPECGGMYDAVYADGAYDVMKNDHLYEEPFLCTNTLPKQHIYDLPSHDSGPPPYPGGGGSLSRTHLVTVNGIAI